MESSLFMRGLRTQLHKITAGGDGAGCRDEAAALRLKTLAVAAILAAGAAGVAVPLAGRDRCLGGGAFAFIKAFSAGLVLATGFVHVLGDAEKALVDPCLVPAAPWQAFPFAGFVALLAALGTLAVDLVCTQLYERKLLRGDQQQTDASASSEPHEAAALLLRDSSIPVISRWDGTDDDAMHVAGTSTQRDSHGHRHSHGEAAHDGHDHGHDVEPSLARRVVVAQCIFFVAIRCQSLQCGEMIICSMFDKILELGIVSHSVIIGLALGISQSPCTIKPLVAALSFHQFFEGLHWVAAFLRFGGRTPATTASPARPWRREGNSSLCHRSPALALPLVDFVSPLLAREADRSAITRRPCAAAAAHARGGRIHCRPLMRRRSSTLCRRRLRVRRTDLPSPALEADGSTAASARGGQIHHSPHATSFARGGRGGGGAAREKGEGWGGTGRRGVPERVGRREEGEGVGWRGSQREERIGRVRVTT
ncbi:hypothetical protein PR202_ga15128 [Eleusine coracana subsp. coracana]|uniref:Uncharacterized protein n=1 Tax=Eleusine coracana subsp. coracana TaxID=191504 RepID=A0AAV5CJE9_ELECO|nr:hypothetical protein PR202_ga15128 [Eleusine coracana subsp. coracana]